MWIGGAWRGLVQRYAEQAAREPGRRAARLEAPPMIPNASGNPKWHEADLRYRQALQQLQKEESE